jgi:2-succinyl-5-enolpyruvyl-6-hydroxy-3-cyclohexene-1-carboxylate synthase
MKHSLPNPSVAFATVVVDEMVRCGVTNFVISPGSRSAALARAAQEHPSISLTVIIDERSAAFFALGGARMSGSPAAVITTSGTAAANLFPAMVEADIAGVPLIALTADRPPELRHTGSNQTIDQIKLFGEVVRWFWESGPAEDGENTNAYWRSSAARAVAEASGWRGRPGPVHLNLAFREPTVPATDDGHSQAPEFTSPTKGRPGGRPWIHTRPVQGTDLSFFDEGKGIERGVVVVGEGAQGSDIYAQVAERLGWPLLAEGLSGARRPSSVSTFHHLLSGNPPPLRPDMILCFGKAGLSPNLSKLLSDPSIPQVVAGAPGAWHDPGRAASHIVPGSPLALAEALLGELEPRSAGKWLQLWQTAENSCRTEIDRILDEVDVPSEPRIARDLAKLDLDGMVVGSSMPVREVDWFSSVTPRTVIGNRGASGIDGLVSTALGAASHSSGRMVCLTGDLALIHDSNGFLVDDRPSCVLVVLNNDGGGIFNFLPQADYPHFEKLFGTPHGRDLQALATFHQLEYRRLEKADHLTPTVESALEEGGVWLVEARIDREENHRLHQRIARETANKMASILG